MSYGEIVCAAERKLKSSSWGRENIPLLKEYLLKIWDENAVYSQQEIDSIIEKLVDESLNMFEHRMLEEYE